MITNGKNYGCGAGTAIGIQPQYRKRFPCIATSALMRQNLRAAAADELGTGR